MTELQDVSRKALSMNQRRLDKAEKELQDLIAQEEQANRPQEAQVVQEDQIEVDAKEPDKEEALSPEEKNWKKRHGDLRRFQQQREKELSDKIEALEARLANGGGASGLPKTEKEIAQWVKQYPDVAAIVRGLAGREAQEQASVLDARLKQLEEMQNTIEEQKAEAELLKFHPDYKEIVETDQFYKWVEDQPKGIQDSVFDNVDAKAVARVLDLYKLDNNIKKASPDKNAALAVTTRTRATPKEDDKSTWFSESQISKMSDRDFVANAEAIEKAQRENRFNYDISGKSR